MLRGRVTGQTVATAWQVGVLFSQSGFSGPYGVSQLRGTLLAIEEINQAGGILGRQLAPIIYDPKSDPRLYSDLANKLLMDDGVSIIFGCTASFSRKVVLPWLEKRNALLWYPTGYEGFDYSPNIIYTGPAPNQLHVDLVEYLFQNYGKKYYCIGSDYVFPRESNRILRELVRERGGEVVAERYIDLSASKDALRFIVSDIKRYDPDIIFSTIVGTATSFLYDAYAQGGLDPERVPIASLTTNEANLMMMKQEPLPGHVTASPYFETIESQVNKVFVERFKRRYGEHVPADTCVEAAYFQVMLFAMALERAEQMDTQLIRRAVLGIEVQAPQGPVMIDADNNHTYLWPRIAVTSRDRKFRVVKSSMLPMKPDPYLSDYIGMSMIA
jgi:branched-chain amino acid transport system substrate-binding protein